MSNKENEIQDRVILVDGEPPSSPNTGMFFAFVDKLLKTKDSGGNIATYPKIEQGSNADGDWMKLYLTEYTGILVCWYRHLFDNGPATADGDFTPALTTDGLTWTQPQTFDGIIHIQASAEASQTGDGSGVASVVSDRNNDGTQSWRLYWHKGISAGWHRRIFLFAIGTFDDTP